MASEASVLRKNDEKPGWRLVEPGYSIERVHHIGIEAGKDARIFCFERFEAAAG